MSFCNPAIINSSLTLSKSITFTSFLTVSSLFWKVMLFLVVIWETKWKITWILKEKHRSQQLSQFFDWLI